MTIEEINKEIVGKDTNLISDGYHTFGELYDHRIELFIQLCKATRYQVWKSKRHSDGELAFGGSWFVLGIHMEKGKQITYHLPISRWNDIVVDEEETAPEWDGHTSSDVLYRLSQL